MWSTASYLHLLLCPRKQTDGDKGESVGRQVERCCVFYQMIHHAVTATFSSHLCSFPPPFFYLSTPPYSFTFCSPLTAFLLTLSLLTSSPRCALGTFSYSLWRTLYPLPDIISTFPSLSFFFFLLASLHCLCSEVRCCLSGGVSPMLACSDTVLFLAVTSHSHIKQTQKTKC